MQKKSSKPAPAEAEVRGIFQQAGEVIGSIGNNIIEGKDKVLDAVSGEFQVVKKAFKKKFARKIATPAKSKKPAAKKAAKKTAPKATPKRGLRKFDRKAKKAAKKSASNRKK